jgi:hypothetical protein
MINGVTAFNGLSKRIEIAKISGDELDVQTVEIILLAGRSSEAADLFAAFEQNSNEMRAYESSTACYQSLHVCDGL